MRKCAKRILLCLMAAAAVWLGSVLRDRQALDRELIRLHIVANSDTEADQAVKLRVRDAVLASLRQGLRDACDVEQAAVYIQENLPRLENAANRVLAQAGLQDRATATLCIQDFEVREYDTFTLPSGLYRSLRIVIGEGEGRNWWCVAFPELCLPCTAEAFAETAAEAGLSSTLRDTLTGREYRLRFFALDALGKLEIFFSKE